GNDITLVSWGALVQDCLHAAEELGEQGISAEVIDVASLRPLDMDTILDSVQHTGRCLIVHEACRTGGFGAEIAARIAESGNELIVPLRRLTAPDIIVPYLRLEPFYAPDSADIVAAAQDMMDRL
ncbi:MAG: transketolase C-terminal domain-containing protein, partial [Pedobacter sp.]|nr:transketolase C-terminal domain-containing protein [Pedobacter sp.]